MACSVNNAVVCQTELHSQCSEDNGHETSSNTDEDFETVEMDFMGGKSTHIDKAERTNAFTRNKWSAATQRVLSSMPSRSVGWSAAVLSQRDHSSVKDFSQVPGTSNRDNDMESHKGLIHEVPQTRHLLRTLQALPLDECARKLRVMPISLTEKSELRALVCRERRGQILSVETSRNSHFQVRLGKSLRGARQGVHSLLTSVQLWHGALKQVSGRFGTGALSYFLFLRTLLLYNVFLSLIINLFLVLPEVIHHPHHSANKISFMGLNIFTGTGILTNSLMFYGYYNYTEDKSCSSGTKTEPCNAQAYNIRLAYLLTIGTGLFATCIMLVYSVFRTLGGSFHVFKSHGNMALKVFSSWDFKVSKMTSVQMQAENLCTQLKEMLCELHSGNPKGKLTTRLIWMALHFTAWGISLTCIFCCVLTVYVFSEDRENVNNIRPDESLLALPFLVCGLNHLMPSVFNMVAWMESYDSPSLCIYVAIISIASPKNGTRLECWETFVGQDLYRFLLMDLIFGVLHTIFGDFLWRAFTQGVLRRKRKPAFDIARNVLELIYGQTLAWFGVLFSPLLPTFQIVKLILLFYLKRASLMMNCQAPRKAWRATQMTTLFISLLCFPSFLGAAAGITYTMWRLEPSSICGPFRMLSSMFLAGKEWRKSLETSNPSLTWLSWAYTVLENPLFLFTIAGLFLLLIYIHIQVGDGQRRIMALLQKQIENEGEDKKFLINKLQVLHEQQEL
ncbi:transmembrane channel-like protein 6 isoform X2 [Colossoma macropomum]|uniref:transmembrane channel-like protein 6 isoform X2 n=1 Tax=Colossoma macropomum TaxID=42526 RepID=UPI001864D63C|nr:transmembrane channel-like protein 6 isoform X2 [Colossoma macropomum]